MKNASFIRWIDHGWDTAPVRQIRGADLRALTLTARLSAMILNPLGFVYDRATPLAPMSAAAVGKIADRPAFAEPFNRLLMKSLSYNNLPFSSSIFERLENNPRTRLSTLIVTGSTDIVLSASLILATAILHKKITNLMLKTDRQRAVNILGEDAFLLATQEAPMLHAHLATLDKTGSRLNFHSDADEDALRDKVLTLGIQAICGYVDACEPSLLPLFMDRFSREIELEERYRAVKELDPLHCDQVLKLFRRRLRSWLDIID